MTAEFIAEVQAEWQGLLARPVGLIDLDREPTRARAVAPVATVAPVLAAAAVAPAAVAPVAQLPGRIMVARFAGRCRACYGRIQPGQTIRYNGKSETYHVTPGCPAAAAPVAPAPAQLAPVATPAAPVSAPVAVAPSGLAPTRAAARRRREAASRATNGPAVAVSVAAPDDWF